MEALVRLNLTSMDQDDLPFFSETRNHCAHWLNDTTRYTLEETREWFENLDGDPQYYILRFDQERVGYFRARYWSLDHDHVEIGADIHPDFRRNGFALGGYVLMLEHMFGVESMHRVHLSVAANNERAISLYRKLLFQTEGVKRQHLKRAEGYTDSIIMSMLEDEWNDYKSFLKGVANDKISNALRSRSARKRIR